MLMQAARFGDTQGIWKYAAEGMDVNERTKDGKTPLILAASGGYAPTVEALVDLGADVNLQDNVGASALITAATAGHGDVVRILLARGADAGLKDRDGGSALLNAVFFGYRDAVGALLKHKEAIPADDLNEGMLIASGMGHTEIVQDMIEAGLDVNVIGLHGRTALMAAAKFDRLDTVKLLLKNGARIDVKNEAGETALQVAQENSTNEIVQLIIQAAVPATESQPLPQTVEPQSTNSSPDSPTPAAK